jgi:N-acetylmuramoyl-L-alanine amidase
VLRARSTRRGFLLALVAILLLPDTPVGETAATRRVGKQRHWSAPDHTRIVVEVDTPTPKPETRYYPAVVPDAARIVLEIPNADAEPALERVDDGLVRSIEIKPLGGSVLVRVELVREADYIAFPLAPNAGGGSHRIVLDVRKRFTEMEKQEQEREAERVRESGDIIVAIDAGHGGNDPGCVGRGRDGPLYEKTVALDVAKRLAAAIERRPRMRAVLTRERDYFVPLRRRQQIAQKYGARVFISIHCNSAPSPTARGSEVFFVSMQASADKAAKELADRENAADMVGGLPKDEIQEPILDILVSLRQNDAMRRSERLGEILVRRLEEMGNEKRGLKQGPFAVLKSISCPSVLVELGFVTNAKDVGMLGDATTRSLYAEHLAAGVEEFVRGAD